MCGVLFMGSLLLQSSEKGEVFVSNNRNEKEIVVQEIISKMREAKSVVFFDYIGINVEEATKMRKEFRANGVECKVYKNTLIKLAAKECGYDEKVNEVLSGSTAIAFGMEDAVAPAKIAKKYVDEFKKMELKAGVVDGDFYDKAMVEKLATIPSKEELIAKMLGSMMAPLSGLARVLNAIAESKGGAATEAAAE